MKKVDTILKFLEEKVVAVLFAIVLVIVFIQVVFRVAGASLSWSEELARYLNIWTIFLAASRCVRLSKHLAVEILPAFLKGNAKKIHAVIIDIICLVFFIYIAFWGAKVIGEFRVYPQYSPALRLNMIWTYSAPFVGMVMMAIRTVQNLIEHIKDEPETKDNMEKLIGGDAK